MNPIITLTTDFGTADHYVAAMKGVILRIAPQVRIVDVTHHVDAQNVLAGAFVLGQVWEWFPEGAIHIAVVDPGVGSKRRLIAGRWGHQIIICPDNGLVSFVHEAQPRAEIYEISNRAYWLNDMSNTFHGRDIMAPTAAHLAAGKPLPSVGPPVDRPLSVHLPQPRPKGDRLLGEVIYVDHFGNLVSNFPAETVAGFKPCALQAGKHHIPFVSGAYAEVGVGAPVAVIGSSRRLEVSINQGSARDDLNLDVGDVVELLK